MKFDNFIRRLVIICILWTISGFILFLVYFPFEESTTNTSWYRRVVKFPENKNVEHGYTCSPCIDWTTVPLKHSKLPERKVSVNTDVANSNMDKLPNKNVIEAIYLDSHGVEWKTKEDQHQVERRQIKEKHANTMQDKGMKKHDSIKRKQAHILDKNRNVTRLSNANYHANKIKFNTKKAPAKKYESNRRPDKLTLFDRKVKNSFKGRSAIRHNCTQSFITIDHPKGQLGNQMFQLAVLLGLAQTTNHTPILTTPYPDLELVFDLPPEIYSDVDTTSFERHTENDTHKSSDHWNLSSSKSYTLDGYFQLFKLFRNIEDQVRDAFKLKPAFIRIGKEFLANNVPPTHVKVGIQVRQGFAVSSYQQQLGRTTPNLSYYKKAMDYYRARHEHVTFIVVSDNKLWCQRNLRTVDTVFSPFNHKGIDLALLSLCDHTIMSVGTFGWWGAWMAGGTVLYYGQQFRPGSELDRQLVKEDYFPAHWISL